MTSVPEGRHSCLPQCSRASSVGQAVPDTLPRSAASCQAQPDLRLLVTTTTRSGQTLRSWAARAGRPDAWPKGADQTRLPHGRGQIHARGQRPGQAAVEGVAGRGGVHGLDRPAGHQRRPATIDQQRARAPKVTTTAPTPLASSFSAARWPPVSSPTGRPVNRSASDSLGVRQLTCGQRRAGKSAAGRVENHPHAGSGRDFRGPADAVHRRLQLQHQHVGGGDAVGRLPNVLRRQGVVVPEATEIRFSPPESTRIRATPVAWSASRSTPAVSMPSRRKLSIAWSPKRRGRLLRSAPPGRRAARRPRLGWPPCRRQP